MTKKDESRVTCTSAGSTEKCSVEAILTIDERGQVLIPKDIREKAHIGPGDKLALIFVGNEGHTCCLSLVKIENLTGMVKQVLGPMMKEMI
ncbi:MAG: HgcAB-associated protein [Methanoregula sp.]